MAAGQVISARRGFTLLELMIVVAIGAILAALSASAMSSARKISRVSGEARLLVQRLQTVRANAVSQGAAQGYYIAQNGPGAGGADANTAFVFYKQVPTTTSVAYVSGTDRRDTSRDTLPLGGTGSLVVVTGAGVAQPADFQIGFDMNGQVTVTPAPGGGFPYCLQVTDVVEPGIVRWVILFNDGTVKVQRNETWCPFP